MSRKLVGRGAVVSGLLSLLLVAYAVAQPPAEKPAEKPASAPSANGKARNPAAAFSGIVDAIKQTPGCLGVDAAQTASGKQVIFAWFKNREAVLDWYYSDEHQKLMAMLGDEAQTSDPLANVAEGEGPLMCVAAVTWAKPDAAPKSAEGSGDYKPQIPISQISVEVFKPVTVAKTFNGAFSPAEALLQPEMAEATP